MESRWCCLTLEAFKRGVLDYSKAYDWRWALKERMVLDSIEDDLVKEIDQLVHQWHCAAAQVTGWDEREELFEYHKTKAKNAYNVIGKNRLPWYKVWEIADSKPLADMWKDFKQRGKDPVYAKQLHEIREKMRKKVGDSRQQAVDYAEMLKRFAESKKKKAIQQRRKL